MLKNKKLLVLASSVLLLAGCGGDIEARPSYEKGENFLVGGEIDSKTKTEDLKNNLRTVVYDALVEGGNINSEVLNETLYILAQLELGSYEDLASDSELKAKINERMDDRLYSAISSSSYEYRSQFDEEVFISKLKQSLTYEIPCPSYTKDYVFLNDSRDHLYAGGKFADGTAYTADAKNGGKYALSCSYNRYKEDVYLPDVYRELLVEKYIVDNEYDSLGRSYARKINYVAIQENSKHPEAAANLVYTWVDKYITNKEATADLDMLAQAWIGFPGDYGANAAEIVELQEEAGLVGMGFDNSLYGDILTDYAKINIANELLTDKTIESEFTGSMSYAPEVGKEIKTNALRKTDLTEDGWFLKSTDLSNLPAALTSRLWDISTANGLKINLNEARTETDSKFVKFINDGNGDGTYYLKPATYELGADSKNYDIVFYDETSSTYYIVQVLEAVNATKLKKVEDGEVASGKQYTEAMRKEAVYEIAKKYGTRDTNKTKAMVEYLRNANIMFHDQDVYDYFLTNYPEMFEDEE